MNKMKKISLIANEISAIIDRINETKEQYENSRKWRKEKLDDLEKRQESDEDVTSWDIKDVEEDYEEYVIRLDVCDDIIKYLESYKF